jgi:hypothetical protein
VLTLQAARPYRRSSFWHQESGFAELCLQSCTLIMRGGSLMYMADTAAAVYNSPSSAARKDRRLHFLRSKHSSLPGTDVDEAAVYPLSQVARLPRRPWKLSSRSWMLLRHFAPVPLDESLLIMFSRGKDTQSSSSQAGCAWGTGKLMYRRAFAASDQSTYLAEPDMCSRAPGLRCHPGVPHVA